MSISYNSQLSFINKTVGILTALLIISGTLLAQNVPQAFKYQTVIRNTNGNTYLNAPIANTPVRLRISIYQGTIGSPVYQEVHQATTNEFGLVSLDVGWGDVISGNFSTIEWGQDDHFLGTEISIPPASFIDMGITQLLSVPYAFVAQRTVEGDADSDPTNELNRDVGFNGIDLSITDAAGTLNVDLSSLDESVEVAAAQATADGALVTADQAINHAATAQTTIDNHIQADKAAWLMDGNLDSDPTTHFIGTTDETDLAFRINNKQAFRIIYDEDNNKFAPSVVLGGASNEVSGPGSVVSGGGAIGIGFNFAGRFSVVGGGGGNHAEASISTIGGGSGNQTYGVFSTIGGGQGNVANGWAGAIAGGTMNRADGENSFAAGFHANALHLGTFVWADQSSFNNFESTNNHQFLIRATGGVGINTNTPTADLDVNGTINASLFTGDGSGLTNINVEDADADATNEIQNFSEVLSEGSDAGGQNISNLGAVSATTFSGDGSGLTNINVEDADADATNEIQNFSEVLSEGSDAGGQNISNLGAVSATTFSGDGSGLININIEDADADPTNEIELPTNPQDGTIAFYNTDAWQVLTPGTDGQVLTLSGGLPQWADPAGSPALQIGDIHEGGYIIYLDASGQHGLVAAFNDLPATTWDCEGEQIVLLHEEIGTGQANTTLIVFHPCQRFNGIVSAAERCNDYDDGTYSDWFLPSKDELFLMYETIGQGAPSPLTNIGNFLDDRYWSSSDESRPIAWRGDFGNGDFDNVSSKGDVLHIRAIREF